MKRPFKHKLAIFLIRLFASTWRIKIKGNFPEKPSIVAFWHGLMLPAWKSFAGKQPRALVSLSKDGELLTGVLEKWGYTVLRGSSSRGGREVLDSLYEEAPKSYLLITPDGPQGPIYEFKAGAAIASFKTGAPLVLCGVKIESKKIFERSWDRFELPLPFSKITIEFNDPIIIPKDSSREEVNKYIKNAEIDLRSISGLD